MSTSTITEVTEGRQPIRRSEGLVFTLTTTNWESSPTSSDIVITRLSDDTDVTTAFTSTATPSTSGDVITLPEITCPADAALGDYRVDMPFTAGGFSPGRPYLILKVTL